MIFETRARWVWRMLSMHTADWRQLLGIPRYHGKACGADQPVWEPSKTLRLTGHTTLFTNILWTFAI